MPGAPELVPSGPLQQPIPPVRSWPSDAETRENGSHHIFHTPGVVFGSLFITSVVKNSVKCLACVCLCFSIVMVTVC